MIPPSTSGRNVPSFFPLKFTVLQLCTLNLVHVGGYLSIYGGSNDNPQICRDTDFFLGIAVTTRIFESYLVDIWKERFAS